MKWVSQLAAKEPRIRAIVAHVTMNAGVQTKAALVELKQYPLVRGVRHNFQDESADYCAQTEFVGTACLAHLGE